MSAELLRVLCNRPERGHTLALVQAGAEGTHSITVQDAVRVSATRFQAVQRTLPLSEFDGRRTYCASCGKVFQLAETAVMDAVRRRVRRIVLEPLGFDLDPMKMLRQRHGTPNT